MRKKAAIATLPSRVLDLVQEVERLHDFTAKSHAERFFTDRLAIAAGGTLEDHREVPYVGTGQLCDLLAELDGQRCFLEVKLLFPSHWLKKGTNGPHSIERYHDLLFAPLESYPWSSGANSVARDFQKIATQPLPQPDYAGVLVVASHDADYDTEPDFAKLTDLLRLDQPPWLRAAQPLDNRYWAQKGFRLDTRVWLCPVGDLPAWWARVRDLYS